MYILHHVSVQRILTSSCRPQQEFVIVSELRCGCARAQRFATRMLDRWMARTQLFLTGAFTGSIRYIEISRALCPSWMDWTRLQILKIHALALTTALEINRFRSMYKWIQLQEKQQQKKPNIYIYICTCIMYIIAKYYMPEARLTVGFHSCVQHMGLVIYECWDTKKK